MNGKTADGRLIVLMLGNAVRLEQKAAHAAVDVAPDLLAAAQILRSDAGQPSHIIAATQARNLEHARRYGAHR